MSFVASKNQAIMCGYISFVRLFIRWRWNHRLNLIIDIVKMCGK